ncbi:hypothetical protein [Nostoc sp. C117]|uniref:hypothetical protein n=1 Tax=Nostoc sp. C117 TaxID=3349875 RepID=UPI00370D843B
MIDIKRSQQTNTNPKVSSKNSASNLKKWHQLETVLGQYLIYKALLASMAY